MSELPIMEHFICTKRPLKALEPRKVKGVTPLYGFCRRLIRNENALKAEQASYTPVKTMIWIQTRKSPDLSDIMDVD